MRLRLDSKAGVGARRPRDFAAAEDAGCERADPAGGEVEIADDARDRPAAVVRRRAEIDLTAGVAKLPGVGPLEHAACALVELCRKPAELGREGGLAARDIAEKARPQDHALRHILPVDPHDRDGRVVIEPGVQIILRDGRRRERAVHIEVRNGEPELVLDGGRGDLRSRAKDLAEILAAADRLASGIRARVTEESIPPEQRPNLSRVSREGLAFLFKETFGRSPPDYVIRRALNLSSDLDIESLARLPAVLGHEEFRRKVADAYRAIMPASIGAEGIFLSALYALARGEARAISKVRRDARREWREIDQIARREMLADLPSTIDELVEQLESSGGEADIEGWADALETTRACAICGTTIVDPYSFAEATLQYYDADDGGGELQSRIETAIRRSSTETGGWGDGSLCAYHNEQASKDD